MVAAPWHPCQVLCGAKSTLARSGTVTRPRSTFTRASQEPVLGRQFVFSWRAQRLRNYFTLFFLVHAIRSGRRTGRRLTTDVAQSRRIPQQFFQTLAHERPTTHVARLFLRPDKLRRAFVLGQQLAYAAQR